MLESGVCPKSFRQLMRLSPAALSGPVPGSAKRPVSGFRLETAQLEQ